MNDIIQLENKFYISVNSTYADDRVRILNHIDTFGIFDRWGDVKLLGDEIQGIYYNGMRFISELELRINNERPLLLSSSVKEENEVLSVDLTNPPLFNTADNIPIAKGVIYIGRSKFIRNGACYEKVLISNYGHELYEIEISLSVNADFKDIFEVRGIKRDKRGEIFEIKHLPHNNILISYLGLDNVKRFTRVHFSHKPDSWDKHNKAVFKLALEPQQQVTLEYVLHFMIGEDKREQLDYNKARRLIDDEMVELNKLMASVSASDQQFSQWVERSQYDLLSLLADTQYGYYPYAGVPWYNTAFGRDGIITALQTLWLAPDISKDVLLFLANTQATETNAHQDAEPGKIIHEMRGGEMVDLGEVPFKRYYGSVDATPLFVMLAGAYFLRTGDLETIKSIWSNIEAALHWIKELADIDGDGFIDYHHKSVNGLVNQGWKDSYDSISDEEGNLAGPPIALCEVQGYVYDAKFKAAILAEALGYDDKAAVLREEAATLKQRFNDQYWDEGLQCYVIALEGEDKPCRIVSSNAGHCLYTGIVDEDKAGKLAATLFAPDMFAGWGIRTLSKKEKRYNPMSYHNGSIWPHDNAIIAMGLSRYGFRDETLKIISALFDASLFIEQQRLPELYCGFDRRIGEGPTAYPVACSPQAWSVGAVFMLLEACLHIEINAKEQRVYFHKPLLPENMDTITIDNLKLGTGYASIELYCEHDTVGIKVKTCPAGWRILLVT